MNVVAYFHAYKFTHYTSQTIEKTRKPEQLTFGEKATTLLLGVSNPRPVNSTKPTNYETIQLQSNKHIECWYLKSATKAKGTIVLFHGYGGEKSSMIDKATVFDSLQYNVVLVDFMGSGGSEGNTTTIGFKEAVEVKTVYDYLISNGEKNIYLYGTSMGGVAIMKAIKDYHLTPKSIIIYCCPVKVSQKDIRLENSAYSGQNV
jgi:hypothetical protein